MPHVHTNIRLAKMKRTVIIAFISIIFLIISNFYYYLETYNWQINIRKDILLKQSLMVRDKLNQFASKTSTSISVLVSQNELDSLFVSKGHSIEVQKRLELLFTSFSDHLLGLQIYDVDGHVFELRCSYDGSFISSFGPAVFKDSSISKVFINLQGRHMVYCQPLLSDEEIIGHVKFDMDLNNFFTSVFHNFNLEGVYYQWLMQPNGTVVYNTLNKKAFYPIAGIPSPETAKEDWFYKVHDIEIDGQNQKVLTVFSKLYFNEVCYYMAFSMPRSFITASIVRYSFLVGGISLLIICIIIAIFSIYQRRLINDEKTLKESEEALRKMVYYMPVGVVLTDHKNRIRQVNRAALKIFAFDDEDQLVGRMASDDILFGNKLRLDKTTYSNCSNKYILKSKSDEESVILHEHIPFYLLREKYSIQVFVEVSSPENERKSEKMANKTKSTFIANISHELRTPLNSIIGMTDILLSSEKDNNDRNLLAVVKRSADTLLALINDILDFSKMESGRFEIVSIPFNLHKEVENTVQSFMPQAQEKQIRLTWKSTLVLPKNYPGDQMRIRQILNNLLSNAVKFTDAGRIHLNIRPARGINGSRSIQFSIQDTGIGIKKEKLDTIFNSFSQEDESTTRKYGGTGLGITISKQLVNMMGGDIWVNSPSGISDDKACPGAEFVFTIPYKSKTHHKHYNFSHIKSLEKTRAFVISDEPLQVSTLMKNLASLRIDFKVFPPSNDTVDIIRTNSKHHVLIVDHRPDFNGLDFLQSLYNHRLHKRIPIIIQSSDFELSNTALAKRLGADVYLRKPVDLKALEEIILKFFPNIEERRASAVEQEGNNRDLNILVAEDNVLNQRIARNLFGKIGYEIDLVANELEALEKIQSKRYDIVFMDVLMPGMNGVEILRLLKRKSKNCPVIAMTESVHEPERKWALLVGIDDFITKPATIEDLMRMMVKWCKQ